MSFLEELKKKVEAQRSPVTVVNRGVTPLSLLGIAFIVLKVMGQITWSWWWVLAPFWVPILLAFIMVAALITMYMVIVSKTSAFTAEVEDTTEKKKTRTKKAKKNEGAGNTGEDEKGS